MQPASALLPAGDHLDSPRLLLRDGTTATVRTAGPSDRDEIRRFYHDLSPESRQTRFFTPAEPSDGLITSLSDDSDPRRALTLIVERQIGDELRPIAVAGYIATSEGPLKSLSRLTTPFRARVLGRRCWSGWRSSHDNTASTDSGRQRW